MPDRVVQSRLLLGAIPPSRILVEATIYRAANAHDTAITQTSRRDISQRAEEQCTTSGVISRGICHDEGGNAESDNLFESSVGARL